MLTVVMNLGNSFQNVLRDVEEAYQGFEQLVVLALRRDAEPGEYRGQSESPLIERMEVRRETQHIVFIDDEGFDPIALGRSLGDTVVLMGGGTSKNGYAAVRVFDGLASGKLVDLQRGGREEILAQK